MYLFRFVFLLYGMSALEFTAYNADDAEKQAIQWLKCAGINDPGPVTVEVVA